MLYANWKRCICSKIIISHTKITFSISWATIYFSKEFKSNLSQRCCFSSGNSDPEREGSSGDSQEKLLSEGSVPSGDSPRDSGCYESNENLENGNDSLPRLWLSSPPLLPVFELLSVISACSRIQSTQLNCSFMSVFCFHSSLCCEDDTWGSSAFIPSIQRTRASLIHIWHHSISYSWRDFALRFHFSPFPFENRVSTVLRDLLNLFWTKRVQKFGPKSILFTVTAWNSDHINVYAVQLLWFR